jgi:hypothetical protein
MTTKILALGDSWFHYPKGLDKNGNVVIFPNLVNKSKGVGVGNIPFYLKWKYAVDLNYHETTLSEMWDAAKDKDYSKDDDLGECGEELLIMVNGISRRNPNVVVTQIPWLVRLKDRIKYYDDNFSLDQAIILISAGGNDMVDKNLPAFLDFENGAPVLKDADFNDAVVDLKNALLKIFDDTATAFPHIRFHFVFHGYDYPPVNGRGLISQGTLIGSTPLQKLLPGPWLTPAFATLYNKAGLPMNRAACENIIDTMIDRFNIMLGTLHNGADRHYVDLRNTADRTNRDACWCNELHYDRDRFIAATEKYNAVIKSII